MSIIRTDAQADALEILKLLIQTVDFYRVMGEELSKENFQHQLFDIVDERDAFITSFQEVTKELGDLPSTPDADREWIEEIAGKLTQLFSDDPKNAIEAKCLEKDEVLANLVNTTTLGEQSAEIKQRLDALNQHLISSKSRLAGD
ncbi:hypothetical protein [Methylophaga sp.]|uniref:hypothetical protein n=1 Tax=Methylophaga sp. TaxID=2024840 RepID=UPI003A9534F7